MRQLITCQICHRFMYEPYALSCGHTYCYSCLSQWLGSNHKKTCPDCRTVITQQPTPSYIIRELVLIFVGRSQLLPDGETSEEHNEMVKEEAEIVAKDKANTDPRTGGLFKGTFKRGHLRLLPIHDPGDGVDRCPNCHWEVEDGYCNQCGHPVGDGFSEFDDDESLSSEDEVDNDIDAHDGNDGFGIDAFGDDVDALVESDEDGDMDPEAFGTAFYQRHLQFQPPIVGPHHRANRSPPVSINSASSDYESEDDDEHDPSMEGFIDDDDPHDYNGTSTNMYTSDGTEVQEVARPPRQRRRAQVVISDDDDEEPSTRAGAIPVDSDDEGPVAGNSQRNKRSRIVPRQRPIAISSDDDSSDDESEANRDRDLSVVPADYVESEDAFQPESVAGGFSPLQQGSTSEHYNESDATSSVSGFANYQEHSDEDGESESDDDDSSENGWGPTFPAAYHAEQGLIAIIGTKSEAPRFMPSLAAPNHDSHRLTTNMQRRSRHANAPGTPNTRLSPMVVPTPRNRSSYPFSGALTAPAYNPRGNGHQAPERSAPIHVPHTYHPFQLSNTLASINHNHSNQQRTANINRSTSANSSQSSTGGGVDVGSSASQSSGDSNQTIGPDSTGPGERRKRDFDRYASYNRSARAAPRDRYEDDD